MPTQLLSALRAMAAWSSVGMTANVNTSQQSSQMTSAPTINQHTKSMSLLKQTDKNYHSIASNGAPVHLEFQKIETTKPKAQWDDCLKLSNAHGVTVIGCEINAEGGNQEDGLDISRFTRGCYFTASTIGSGGKYAITIKGGSYNITISDCIITGDRGWEGVDIDIGNFSDFNYANTHSITLENVVRRDLRPVTVRIGHATDVDIIGGNVKVLVVQSLLIKAYVWSKFHLQRIFNKKRK